MSAWPALRAPAPAPFHGAKAALFHENHLLTLQRDDRPGLAWRGCHDLPGGGREGEETGEACLLRELAEEFGLILGEERLVYRRQWPSMNGDPLPSWFFAGQITAAEIAAIRFGKEGQGWQMMALADYLTHPLAIPALQHRIRQAVLSFGDRASGLTG